MTIGHWVTVGIAVVLIIVSIIGYERSIRK
jgi:hypothetical protein